MMIKRFNELHRSLFYSIAENYEDHCPDASCYLYMLDIQHYCKFLAWGDYDT